MSIRVDVLTAIDHNLKDRAERAARYGKKADREAERRGSRNPMSDRKADFERHLLEQLSASRAAVADLVSGYEQIKHSIQQARMHGNDWRRDLALIENTADEALARARGDQ